MKGTQSSHWFQDLPTPSGFVREYEAQDTIPGDGSRSDLRTYSPFVIRVLPPSILGDPDNNVLSTGLNPQRGPGQGGTIRESNRDSVNYALVSRGVSQVSDSHASYNALVAAGGALPGLSSTSLTTIQSRYNQALHEQVFGPATQRTLGGSPSRTITPALSNDLAALNILYQVKQILDTPPLIMLINPQSMSRQMTKVAQFQERTRKGYVYQAWGEELQKINFHFKIGAYTVGGQGLRGPSGVTRAGRRDSASYQQLMTLLTMFQSSGYIQDTVSRSKAHLMIGNLAVEYDQNVYVGHFDTFNLTEEESQQGGGLEFDMEFTAVRVYDLASPAGSVGPMTSPTSPYSSRSRARGTLVSGNTTSVEIFSAPTVGFPADSQAPVQPWAGAVSGATFTDNGPVLSSRRNR